MQDYCPTDYNTYKEIAHELMLPIEGNDLDVQTLKSLYESKLIYLKTLRLSCFREINGKKQTKFQLADYKNILKAIDKTNAHLHDLIVLAVSSSMVKNCP